jgi:hypothetical protein
MRKKLKIISYTGDVTTHNIAKKYSTEECIKYLEEHGCPTTHKKLN